MGDLFPEARVDPALDENRRYTTRSFMHWVKEKARVLEWDLDPAADAESHHAPRWFCAPGDPSAPQASGVDGLSLSWAPPDHWLADIDVRRAALWAGPDLPDQSFNSWFEARTWRVFVNPPFDDLGSWVAKAWQEIEAASLRPYASTRFYFRIGFIMPANRPEQDFWQRHIEPFRDYRSERAGYRLETHYPPGRQRYGHPGNPEGKPSPDFPSVALVWRAIE